VLLGAEPYRQLSKSAPGTATALASGVLGLTASVAGAVCLGGLVTALVVTARRSRDRIENGRDLRVVRVSATVWMIAAVLLIAVDAADDSGEPLTKLLTPGALGYLVSANYLPGAWIVTAVTALVVLVAANIATRWSTVVLLAAASAVGVLAPVLVTQVLVGPNHDFSGDAAMFGTPAFAVLLGATTSVALRWRRHGRPGDTTLRRFRVLVVAAASTWLGATLVIWAVELAGTAPLASTTGVLFLVEVVALVVVLAAVTPWRGRSWSGSRVTVLLAALLLAAGTEAVRTRVPPPVYFVPTNTQQLFLGYDVTAPLTPVSLFLDGRVNILFLVIALTGIVAYASALVRLRRRGDAWPVGRTVSWMLGWTVVIVTTSSGIGPYSSASFAVHMGLHMSINMLGPLLLVLGGPVTLFLRATTAHRRDGFAGPHEWLTAMLHAPFLRMMFNPLYALAVFIGSYYVIYLTPFFGWAMRYHWAHQGMTLEYLDIGYVFYALVIGIDKQLRPVPYIGKLGLVLAAMPFHAFFGVVVMTSKDILGKIYYQYIDVPWIGSLAHDQYVAGGIAWAAGELPLVVVVIALVTQWARQDARQAKRQDRAADRGLDDTYEQYNAMLQQLAGARRAADGPTELTIREHEAGDR
jgi:cytochrome c oxidase assembly factor CtaG